MGICSAAGVGSGVGQYAEHIWEIRSEQNQKELLGVWVSALRRAQKRLTEEEPEGIPSPLTPFQGPASW